jgi:ribonuclease HIII
VAICGSNRTKAESDAAVAAASILARDRFVGWLGEASEALGTTLPKGAGPQVITTARALVAAHGPDILREYAKVSFKTTRAVLENTP